MNGVSIEESGVKISSPQGVISETDWASWRGPTSDGIAPDQSLPTEWGEDRNLKWRTPVPGRGHSSPIVVNDLIVLGTAIDAAQQQFVVAYDRSSGKERWRTLIHQGGFPSKYDMHNKSSHANGTLASDGTWFYSAMLHDEKISVTALDQDGQLVWQQDAGGFASKFGYAASPVIHQSLLILSAESSAGGFLAALDTRTGDLAWRMMLGRSDSYSSPTVATIDGVDRLLICGGGRIASHDPGTGSLQWSVPFKPDATCGTIIVANDRIYASGGFPEKETVCLSAEGEMIWSDKTGLYEPSLIASQEFLFGVTDDGIAHAWNVDDGTVVWRERLGGGFSSSPILCNGNVYVANLKGKCFVFRANGDAFDPMAENRLGDDMYASPAVSRGELFLRVGFDQADGRAEQLICISDQSSQTGSP